MTHHRGHNRDVDLESIERTNRNNTLTFAKLSDDSIELIGEALTPLNRMTLRQTSGRIGESLETSRNTDMRSLRISQLMTNTLKIVGLAKKVNRYTLKEYMSKDVLRLSHLTDQLDASDMHAVSHIIVRNTNLRSLFLNNNQIGDDGLTHLSKAIAKSNTLHRLELNHNNISENSVKNLAKALHTNTSVKMIRLAGNRINFKGATFFIKPNLMRGHVDSRFAVDLRANPLISKRDEQRLQRLPGSSYIFD